MAYSYSTCGHINAFTSWSLDVAFQNVSLNVVYLTNTGGWKGSYCTSSDSASCTGPTVDVWNQIFERGASPSIASTFTSKSLASGANFSLQVQRQMFEEDPDMDSTFTACVYATGMGFVDICVGAATIKPSRVMITDMIQLGAEPVVLVVKMSKRSQASKTTSQLASSHSIRCFGLRSWSRSTSSQFPS